MTAYIEKLKNLFSRSDMTARIVCLLAAVVLWAFVVNTKMGEVNLRIPIEYKSLPGSLVVAEKQSRFVTISFSGRREDIKDLGEKNVKAYINLEHAVAGEDKSFPIEIAKRDIPDSVSVELYNEKIPLVIEKRAYKRVRIVPHIVGNPREGLALGSVKLAPDYATISGSESQIMSIERLATKRISVERMSQSATREAYIDKAELGDITVDVPRVTAYLPIVDAKGLLRVEVPIRIHNPGRRFECGVMEKSAAVYLKPLQGGGDITAESIEVFVDIDQAAVEEQLRASGEAYIERSLPLVAVLKSRRESFKLALVVPESVVVRINKKQ